MPEENSNEDLERWRKIKRHATPIFLTSVYDYPDLETLDDYYNGKIPNRQGIQVLVKVERTFQFRSFDANNKRHHGLLKPSFCHKG